MITRSISVLWWSFFVASMGIISWLLLKPWILAELQVLKALL